MEIFDNDLNAEVIGFGALNVDKLYSVENIASKDEESFIKGETDTPGGSAANTMVGLSRLGCSTSIIGKIAEDDDGDLIEYNLAINGIYTNNLIYSETGATGKCLGFVDSNGERCLYIDPGVNDEIRLDEINPLNIMRCKIMHYTSFVGDSFNTQIELLDLLNKECILSFDPGMLYVQKGFDELKPILDRTDILLINESELRLLCNNNESSLKELAIGFLDMGIETVVIKQGSKGVFAMNNNETCEVESYKCDVVDTTGAGDSFNSGFLYSYLKGYDLEKSCQIGNWVASKAIEGFGMEKFPSLKDLEDFF
ncbi:MAG: carbohydrate kinase family protein [Methanobrevibacter sp.]|uniref:carbohydrate kinase family protein n=1 Tax=Methanobrevibacter sp. TaxID=66852 RepID=UPI00258119D7|nr:carbohydrate kinase family protein [Methanobrevibacter sp.]MBR2665828.1 carbohydrate kinase family protein [Methanobrevibacter sp.]MBR3197348.1 carbohydrate kinase family protein [Methanobrevibacter sp.]MBR7050364.1 carbohydrate kinase family protein [Methanobrevibacter sp.]